MIAIIIPSALSIILSVTNMILGYMKEKRNKDDISWETAKEIILKCEDLHRYSDKGDAIEIAKYFDNVYRYLKMVRVNKNEIKWESERDKWIQEISAHRET